MSSTLCSICAETKKSTKVSTPPSTEPPVIPFDVPGEVGQAVLDDHAEGDPENPLDSSMEEVENAPSPIKPTEQDNKCTLPRLSLYLQ